MIATIILFSPWMISTGGQATHFRVTIQDLRYTAILDVVEDLNLIRRSWLQFTLCGFMGAARGQSGRGVSWQYDWSGLISVPCQPVYLGQDSGSEVIKPPTETAVRIHSLSTVRMDEGTGA
jgi:hypothetical protein